VVGGASVVAVAAFTLLLAVTLAFQGTLVGSPLGGAVAVQVRGVDYAAAAATLFLAGLGVADVLYISLHERAAEFATLRAVGWRESVLARLLVTEGTLIGAAGPVVGAGQGPGGGPGLGKPASPAVQVVDVSKRYRTLDAVVTAADHVTLDIAAGSTVALTGPSGSGKSTLLHMIGALDRPDSGTITVNGQLITGLNRRRAADYRAGVGFVFQQRFNLLAALTVLDNVLTPALLLADEPTGNLDTGTGTEIAHLLLGLRDRLATIVILATHNPALANAATGSSTCATVSPFERRSGSWTAAPRGATLSRPQGRTSRRTQARELIRASGRGTYGRPDHRTGLDGRGRWWAATHTCRRRRWRRPLPVGGSGRVVGVAPVPHTGQQPAERPAAP